MNIIHNRNHESEGRAPRTSSNNQGEDPRTSQEKRRERSGKTPKDSMPAQKTLKIIGEWTPGVLEETRHEKQIREEPRDKTYGFRQKRKHKESVCYVLSEKR